MKNKILFLIVMALMIIGLMGCGVSYAEVKTSSFDYGNGYFTALEKWSDESCDYNYYIVYANNTGVKYLIIDGIYYSAISPLYNADGTLQVYEEED